MGGKKQLGMIYPSFQLHQRVHCSACHSLGGIQEEVQGSRETEFSFSLRGQWNVEAELTEM